MTDNLLWKGYLGHEDLRIWGATSLLSPENKAYYQLKAYDELRRKNRIRTTPPHILFDYLARLMKGGPLRFSKLPNIEHENPAEIQPKEMEEMKSSLVVGRNKQKNLFLALHLVDEKADKEKECVLVFIKTRQRWFQPANAFWKENALDANETHVVGYLLDLINEEKSILETRQYGYFNGPEFIRTVSLKKSLFSQV